LSNLRLEGPVTPQRPAYLDQYFPFIDAYGQFMHEDWPGKVRSAEDLRKAHAAELALLAESKRPAAWNRFGGWADGPQLWTEYIPDPERLHYMMYPRALAIAEALWTQSSRRDHAD